MTFHLRTGEAHGIEPLQDPSPQKVEYEVRNTHLGSGDPFVVLVDESRDAFVQCRTEAHGFYPCVAYACNGLPSIKPRFC